MKPIPAYMTPTLASLVAMLAAVGFLASTPWIDPMLLGAAFVATALAALLVNVARARRGPVSSEIEPATAETRTERAPREMAAPPTKEHP